MQKQVFRHYDIRGRVGSEFIINEVPDVIKAFLSYVIRQYGPIHKVVIGRDARTHSEQIAQCARQAALLAGVAVYDLGMVTTPMNVFAQHYYQADVGIMVTASHNPSEYNGLKLFAHGKALHADELQMIYDLYAYKKYTDFSAQGLLVCVDNFAQLYIDDLIEKFPALYQQSLDVVFDAGCAAASAVVPLLQNAFNWANAHNICTDTKTPLHEADPSKLKNIEHAIAYARQHKLQGVIAFDGDADRLVVATSSGCIFSGDELLAVFAQYTCASGDTIVVDSKTSSIVQRVCPGVRVVYAPTGAQEVMQTMHTSGAKLAGEVSGHYFFADRHLGYDDGIYASLRLLEIMLQHNVSLQELYDRLPVRFMSPEYRILVTDSYKQAILQDMQSFVDQHQHYVCTLVDGVRFSDDQGWALCRASNTESLLSIRFEGIHEQAYEKFKNIVMTILQPYGLHQNIK